MGDVEFAGAAGGIDGTLKLIAAEGFFEDLFDPEFLRSFFKGVGTVTGAEENFLPWPDFAHFLCEFQSVHYRHIDIGNDQIKGMFEHEVKAITSVYRRKNRDGFFLLGKELKHPEDFFVIIQNKHMKRGRAQGHMSTMHGSIAYIQKEVS